MVRTYIFFKYGYFTSTRLYVDSSKFRIESFKASKRNLNNIPVENVSKHTKNGANSKLSPLYNTLPFIKFSNLKACICVG